MHRKVLGVSLTAILVGAMLIPLAGTASAQVDSVTLDPPADSAPIDTCNVFEATVLDDSAAAAADTVVDAQITQEDGDTARDNRIEFCDPDTGDPVLPADLDDNAAANDDDTPTDPPAAGSEGEANANTLPVDGGDGVCTTIGTTGACEFGVLSDEAGTMTVEAFAFIDDAVVAATPATKTWTSAAVDTVDCEPETESNLEGSLHEFTCQALVGTTPISGETVWFDVTAGPNAEEIAFQQCALATDATGTTTCSYTDDTSAGSPPGTDTIIGYVNLDCPRTGVTTCSDAPETDEPQDEILKTFTGAGRIIDCEPETAENTAGTTHIVTCTVTDRAGNPVPGVTVEFTETGPGRFSSGEQTSEDETDADGVATADLASTAEEEGDQSVTGEIVAPAGAVTECARAAGDPAGAPAGACTDDVTKTWVAPQVFREPSSVSIRHRVNPRHVFKGKVTSARGRCERGRSVRIKKVRSGPDRTVGRDRTNRRGRYSEPHRRGGRGRYYAVAARKSFTTGAGDIVICQTARSRRIGVRR